MVGSSSSNTLQAACTIQSGVRPTFMDSSAWTFAAAVAAASVSSSLSSLESSDVDHGSLQSAVSASSAFRSARIAS